MTFGERADAALRSSCICIGLDPDVGRLPEGIEPTPEGILTFNRQIVDATADLASAYKPNCAFYESLGVEGWRVLKSTIQHIRLNHPSAIVIADAKRGDIGNTAEHYARAVFDELDADAITVHPYMGGDSVAPFCKRVEKGAFVLALTSNPGSGDFQRLRSEGRPLYVHVIECVRKWNVHQNIGLVIGATHPEDMAVARQAAGDLPFLVPGIGAQGGDLRAAVSANRVRGQMRAWINVSRGVLYASSGRDYPEAARKEVERLISECRCL